MTSSPTFHFMNLLPEIQVLVMNKLPFDDLIKFRHSCRHFFHLTDTHKHQQTKTKTNLYELIKYQSDKHEFQRLAVKGSLYQDLPTSNFWTNFEFRIKLSLLEVREDDQENFMEKLKKLPFKFTVVHYNCIPVNLMNELLAHFNYVTETAMGNFKFFTDEFLCSNALKNLRGNIMIVGDIRKSGEVFEIVEPLMPIKGINHVIKRWQQGDYQFANLVLSPISDDINLTDIMKDVNYVWIFNIYNHEYTPLRELDLQKLAELNKCKRYIVAVKQTNSEECCLITINWDRMFLRVCNTEDVIQEAITRDFMPELGKIYSKECLDTVCKQKLF